MQCWTTRHFLSLSWYQVQVMPPIFLLVIFKCQIRMRHYFEMLKIARLLREDCWWSSFGTLLGVHWRFFWVLIGGSIGGNVYWEFWKKISEINFYIECMVCLWFSLWVCQDICQILMRLAVVYSLFVFNLGWNNLWALFLFMH